MKKNYPDELDPEKRDPRLTQTVAFPGQRMKPERDANPYIFEWPALAGDGTAFVIQYAEPAKMSSFYLSSSTPSGTLVVHRRE